jgi:preprotein translocase subunit YajC
VYIAPTRADQPRRRPTEGFLVFQAAAASGSGSGLTTILFLLLLFGVVYFLMIRPQTKRRREAMQLQNSLGAGDRIVTIGGLHATIVEIDGDEAKVEIAPGVQVTFARAAIARALPTTDAAPADEEPVADAAPVAEEPVVEEPVVKEPVAEAPVVDEPVAEKPAVEEPVDSPVADTRKKD